MKIPSDLPYHVILRELGVTEGTSEEPQLPNWIESDAIKVLKDKGILTENLQFSEEGRKSFEAVRAEQALREPSYFRFCSMEELIDILKDDIPRPGPVIETGNSELSEFLQGNRLWLGFTYTEDNSNSEFLEWEQAAFELFHHKRQPGRHEEFLRFAQTFLLYPYTVDTHSVFGDYKTETHDNYFSKLAEKVLKRDGPHESVADKREILNKAFKHPQSFFDQDSYEGIRVEALGRRMQGLAIAKQIKDTFSEEEINIYIDAFLDDTYLVENPDKLRVLFRATTKIARLHTGFRQLSRETTEGEAEPLTRSYDLLLVFDKRMPVRDYEYPGKLLKSWHRPDTHHLRRYLRGTAILTKERTRRANLLDSVKELDATLPVLNYEGELLT